MNIEKYHEILSQLPSQTRLVAVSKTKPASDIQALYDEGQRVFGENHAQEMKEKHEALPDDIQWHFIGHLQRNKIKYIAPYVAMIHSIDTPRLLEDVNRQALKNGRVIPCLLQFHIALEETKFGFSLDEARAMLQSPGMKDLENVRICGVMGMATFTDDMKRVRGEFKRLHGIFNLLKSEFFAGDPEFKEVSMGMTGDYKVAEEEGSTMIRVGSAIFGARNYPVK